MLSATFGVGQALWTMFWFFLFVIWILLLFRVFTDIFRSDMKGIAKLIWLLFVIITPYLGVFVYLIVRGGKMTENEIKAAQAQEAAVQSYIRQAAGSTGVADELERLAGLRDKGVLSEAEFQAAKGKLIS
jgi:predicted membrane protein